MSRPKEPVFKGFKDRICWVCNERYPPTGANQKYCPDCMPLKTRLWKQRNPEAVLRHAQDRRDRYLLRKQRDPEAVLRQQRDRRARYLERKLVQKVVSRVLAPRVCLVCSELYTPTGTPQKYCPACIPTMKKHNERAWQNRNRERINAYARKLYAKASEIRPKGLQLRVCQRCNEVYPPTGSNQKYCPDCIPITKKRREHAWKRSNPDLVHKYASDRLVRYREKLNAQKRAWHKARVFADPDYVERRRAAARRSAAKRRAKAREERLQKL
jgi:hypothetical protein